MPPKKRSSEGQSFYTQKKGEKQKQNDKNKLNDNEVVFVHKNVNMWDL